jgi:hypothetical protein
MILSDTSKLGKYSRKKIHVKCDNCGDEKHVVFKDYNRAGYSNDVYYCRKCKLEKNNLEKYGVKNVFQLESVKQKIKKTNTEKYGVDNPSKSEDIKKKKKETFSKKYGVEHPLKNEEVLKKQLDTVKEKYGVDNVSQLKKVKEKKKETTLKNYGVEYISQDPDFKENLKLLNLEKYGTEYSLQSEYIKNKIKKTNIEKYGVDNPSKSEDIKKKIKQSILSVKNEQILKNNPNIIKIDNDNKIFSIICEDCREIYDITYPLFYKHRETNTVICTNCNPIHKNISGKEIMLFNYIKSVYNGETIQNYRLENKEIDIFLPEFNLGIEFNGIYYHSDLFKGKNYHYDKTKFFENNGIRIIHVWEDDWEYKEDLIKSMLNYKINLIENKIYARNCEVKLIEDNDIIRNFLNENHIQGYVNSTYKIGLFHNENLVSLMTFKKEKESFLLNRFCNIKYHSVIGSASKLLKYFTYNISDKIFTFSDNSYSDGKLYENLGFEKIYDIKPDYKYIVGNFRSHKFNFRKKDTSNLNKIYDAGKVKYMYIAEYI